MQLVRIYWRPHTTNEIQYNMYPSQADILFFNSRVWSRSQLHKENKRLPPHQKVTFAFDSAFPRRSLSHERIAIHGSWRLDSQLSPLLSKATTYRIMRKYSHSPCVSKSKTIPAQRQTSAQLLSVIRNTYLLTCRNENTHDNYPVNNPVRTFSLDLKMIGGVGGMA